VLPPLSIPFRGRGRWRPGDYLHFFVDDYRQEFCWRHPEEGKIVALAAGVVTAPDFSIFAQDPEVWRNYQAWRSALIGAYWQESGVTVIPVVSFHAPVMVAPGSWWAIRAPSYGAASSWRRLLCEWHETAQAAGVLVFGRIPSPDHFAEPLDFVQIRNLPLRPQQVEAAQKEGCG
jgi:hypothetical protein